MITPKKVLIIRQGGIGDILFTLPAVNMLKDNFPDCHLTYLTKNTFAPLLKGFAALDDIIIVDNAVYHSRNLKKIYDTTIGLYRKLRQEHYQLVVDFHGLEKTALITRLTGAKNRWGVIRKNFSRWFYNISHPIPEDLHRIDLNLQLLEKGGLKRGNIRNDFVLPQEDLLKAKILWEKWGLSPGKPTLFIQPFTNFPRKNWPLENYLTVAKYWESQNIQVVFGGGPKDKENLAEIALEFPVAAGQADFLTTAGLMKLSTLVLGGDTGMLHLAGALSKKVLMLMDGTEYPKFYPYQHPEWALIPDKNFKISEISTNQVKKKISGLLE